MKYALTYDDIQLIPKYSDVSSRQNVKLHTLVSKRYGLLRPIVAAPMETVCEFEMAYKMAEMGGVGCIHRFMSIEEQAKMVEKLHTAIYHETIVEPSIAEAWGVMYDDWHAEIKAVPIMAAIGVQEDDFDRAKMLVKAGANILLIDVAHGHHQKVIDMIKWCKDQIEFKHVDIIAGSIATAAAACDLERAGADGLRCGVGGGAVCTTRIRTGFGIPNVKTIEDIVEYATVPIIADGGIRNSGDIAKALALGADCVMLGSILAGTTEASGKLIITDAGLYKEYMGSASALSKKLNGFDVKNIEGESTKIPYKGDLKQIFEDLIDGVKSALSYAGANDLNEYCPEYVVVTNSGIREASPHLLQRSY